MNGSASESGLLGKDIPNSSDNGRPPKRLRRRRLGSVLHQTSHNHQ